MKRLFISLILICVMVMSADAATVAFAWNTAVAGSSAVTGYKIYYGTASGTYTSNQDMGLLRYGKVTGLTAGVPYYFAIVAYSAEGESSVSGEVTATPTDPTPVSRRQFITSYPR